MSIRRLHQANAGKHSDWLEGRMLQCSHWRKQLVLWHFSSIKFFLSAWWHQAVSIQCFAAVGFMVRMDLGSAQFILQRLLLGICLTWINLIWSNSGEMVWLSENQVRVSRISLGFNEVSTVRKQRCKLQYLPHMVILFGELWFTNCGQ